MQTKKVKMPKVPRSLDDIKKAYGPLLAEAGQEQYKIYLSEERLKEINVQLKALNNEGAARQQLDRQADNAEQPKPAVTTAEQAGE